MNGSVDILVSVPESVLSFLKREMPVPVTAQKSEIRGTVIAVIPKGDITTRTFPVKIRVATNTSLMEGMEARVRLPIGKKIEVFLVPRDAVLNMSGKTSIVAVIDSRASLIPVTVVGYHGTKAGIEQGDITEDMAVVVKGNERLRDGDPVTIIEEIK